MIVLRRCDPAKRMARFYALSLQRSLFGETMLIRRWGRIGVHGQVRHDWFEAKAEATLALARIADAKIKRGYRLVPPEVVSLPAKAGRDLPAGTCGH